MIFDGRPIDEISDEEIDELVREHVSERLHLEFKVTINYKDETDKLELLRDISSLANSGGGYLIIGIRDDGKGCAQKYEPSLIGHTQKIKQAIASLCLAHISDRIDGLQIRLRTVDQNPLVMVRVPESTRIPHMVTLNHRTDFYKRYEDGKREMTLTEIREAFNQDLSSRQFRRIESQLAALAAREQIQQQRDEISKKTVAGVVPRFITIEDGDILADATLERFVAEIGDAPFFRIAITPTSPTVDLVDVDSENVRKLLAEPPGSRSAGWNMESYSAIERFEEGIRRGERNYEYLELLSNGHMEFWTPLNEHFCWMQSQEEFRTRPRLYSIPVIEYPATFLRLYRALVNILGIESNFLIDLQYRNLTGYNLNPYAPGTFGFLFPDEATRPFEQQNLGAPRKKVTSAFEPDQTAYDLVRFVYTAFGVAAKKIPFFTDDGKFLFPQS